MRERTNAIADSLTFGRADPSADNHAHTGNHQSLRRDNTHHHTDSGSSADTHHYTDGGSDPDTDAGGSAHS